MSTDKPAIVLIHGSWHTPATYKKFTTALEASGFEVHCPTMPTMNGTRPHNADLADDTALIQQYVASLLDAGRVVIAVMHSYGGQVGTNALVGMSLTACQHAGKPGGVTRLVYLCAFALPEGGSMIGKVKEFGHEHLLDLAFDFAEDQSVVSRDPKTLVLDPGLSEQEADKYLGSLARWNGKSMYDPIERCAWREMPVTYVMTSQDMTVPLDYQKDMVEKMRAAGTQVETVELATGHCPNATATKECVDVIVKVAAS